MFIHLRLTEIFDTSDDDDGFFGRKHIILFGDLLQLPPVKGKFAFTKLTKEEISKHIKSMDTHDLWNKFDYDELTINMRQKNDEQYSAILSRIRLGFITEKDIDILQKRQIRFSSDNPTEIIEQLCAYLNSLNDDTVCLLPTKAMCSALNDAMLQRIDSEEIYLRANDSFKCSKNLEKTILKLLNEDDDNCGIQRDIKVKINAKVMIKRNIDVSIGLVNGTIGTVTSISKDKTGDVTHIIIRLKTGEEFTISRIEYKFIIKDNIYIIRQQFPICLSYGITIHKSQGISVQNAVVDAGNSMFDNGQTYVAFSRVTKLEGLHLINFAPSRVVASESAIREYNRLRRIFRPDLQLLDIPVTHIYQKLQKRDHDIHWTAFRNISATNDSTYLNYISDNIWNIHKLSDENGITSYANVCIQSLFHSTTLRRILTQHSGFDPLKTIFNQYISKSFVNVLSVREYVDKKYTVPEQQDASDFLMDLCKKSTFLQNILVNQLRTLIVCPGCNTSNVTTDTPVYMLSLHLPEPTRAYELQELLDYNFGHWHEIEDKCNNNCKCKQRQMFSVNVKSTLLILQLSLFTTDEISTSKITNFKLNNIPKSKVSIEKKSYRVASGIFHHGKSVSEGHYTNMLRQDKHWIKVYNSFITKKSWPKGAKDVYILFLERI